MSIEKNPKQTPPTLAWSPFLTGQTTDHQLNMFQFCRPVLWEQSGLVVQIPRFNFRSETDRQTDSEVMQHFHQLSHKCIPTNQAPPRSPLKQLQTSSALHLHRFQRGQRGEITISRSGLSARTEKWRKSCNLLITHNSRHTGGKQAHVKCTQWKEHNQEHLFARREILIRSC